MAKAGELEDLLRRHANSLRHVALDYFNLISESDLGAWPALGGSIQEFAPNLELIIGFAWANWRRIDISGLLPLELPDVSGLKNARLVQNGEDEDEDGDGDGDEDSDEYRYEQGESESETDDEGHSDNLAYSTDDSSSESDEPRRKPDTSLLDTVDQDF